MKLHDLLTMTGFDLAIIPLNLPPGYHWLC
jgi:hypothetical protein